MGVPGDEVLTLNIPPGGLNIIEERDGNFLVRRFGFLPEETLTNRS